VPLTDQMQERLESLKVGVVSGSVTLVIWAAIALATNGLHPHDRTGFLLAAGIAGFSGLLFGVTYRYVIRHDRNPHLKSGAVGAFALVRGLAQIEPLARSWPLPWLLLLLLLGQNLAMFTGARWVLDWGRDRGWLSRFPMVTPPLMPLKETDASIETSVDSQT
jgi:predicted permease